MSRFIDEHRGRFGVEPICSSLGVSASAYYERKTGTKSERAVEDERLLAVIRQLHEGNYFAYGYRRMWIALKALRRSGRALPRPAPHEGARHPGRQAPRQALADDEA